MDKEEQRSLLARAGQGDKAAKDRLVEGNLGLVGAVVKRYERQQGNHDREDLFQVGVIGLIKAVDKFHLDYNNKFSTYAIPMIQGEIRRFLRDDGLLHVSRSLKEKGWRIRQAQELLQAGFGREPSLQEISAETGLSPEEILLAQEANAGVRSYDQTFADRQGDRTSLADKMMEGESAFAGTVTEYKNDKVQDKILNHIFINDLLNDLPEEEYDLVRLRYFEDQTQVQTARLLGMSQVQVSRLEKKILRRLRAKSN